MPTRKKAKHLRRKRHSGQTRKGGVWPLTSWRKSQTTSSSKKNDHLEEKYIAKLQHEKMIQEFKKKYGKKLDSLPEDVILKIYSQLYNHQVKNIGRTSRTMRDHAKTEFKARKDWVKHLLKEPDAFTKLGIEKKRKSKGKSKSKSKSKNKSKSK